MALRRFMATLPSGLPEFVQNDEALSRSLVQSNQLGSIMAKPAAFLPNPKDRETSVFRRGAESLPELWAMGAHAAGARTLYGAAILNAFEVRAIGLDVIAGEPPPRHAAIRGWPWFANDPELQKAQQKELTLLLASKADLVRR